MAKEKKVRTFVSRQLLDDTECGYTPAIRAYFKTFGLRPGHAWSTYDYLDWVSARQMEFQAVIHTRKEHPKDFWAEFEEWLTDQAAGWTYVVYQPTDHHFNVALSGWKKWGLAPHDTHYEPIWSGKLAEGADPDTALETFRKCVRKARLYEGWDIEVGDVIVISNGKTRTAWFYDTGGLVRIRNFERARWPSKKKEEKAV